jgi:hypothetical protein
MTHVTTVEQGYKQMSERLADCFERLSVIQIIEDSPILADDRFFHPIFRTLSQDVSQCLLSALDHLRFLVWSLKTRDKPYPVAQATLVRTAITGAATALWMISGSSPHERRCRAMQFMFNDIRSQINWMDSTGTQPPNKERPAAEIASFQDLRTDLDRRLDWIVEQANTLLEPPEPFTRRAYGKQQITSDTDLVKAAGAITPAIGMGGWNSGLVLLNSWQVLSGYAHARPWATALGSRIVVDDPEPDPVTGAIKVTAKGDPDRLLDFAFRAIIVVENGISWLTGLTKAA